MSSIMADSYACPIKRFDFDTSARERV